MFINFDFVVDFSGANGNGHQRTAMVRFIMPELELGTMVEVIVFFGGDGWLFRLWVFFLVKMVLELGAVVEVNILCFILKTVEIYLKSIKTQEESPPVLLSSSKSVKGDIFDTSWYKSMENMKLVMSYWVADMDVSFSPKIQFCSFHIVNPRQVHRNFLEIFLSNKITKIFLSF